MYEVIVKNSFVKITWFHRMVLHHGGVMCRHQWGGQLDWGGRLGQLAVELVEAIFAVCQWNCFARHVQPGAQLVGCEAIWSALYQMDAGVVCPTLTAQLIPIDGKSVRGSHDGEQSAIHLVSAWNKEAGLMLGQAKTAAKSNEITAIPELLVSRQA
jgi:hypothetical protein